MSSQSEVNLGRGLSLGMELPDDTFKTVGRRWIDGKDRMAVNYSHNVKIQELSEGRWIAFVRLQDGSSSSFFPVGPIGASPEDVGWYLSRHLSENRQ